MPGAFPVEKDEFATFGNRRSTEDLGDSTFFEKCQSTQSRCTEVNEK